MQQYFMDSADLRAAYIRAGSLGVGVFDFACTIPAEIRFYAAQKSFTRTSQQCMLFIATRYISVIVIVLTSIGFFGTGFSHSFCTHFHWSPTVFKILQTVTSQVVLASRTYRISGRAPWVKWFLLAVLAIFIPAEFIVSLIERIPFQDDISVYKTFFNSIPSCISANPPAQRIAWSFYVIGLIYDLCTIGISTVYLWNYSTTEARMGRFLQRLFFEGLAYFVFLTAANVANIIFFRNSNTAIQSSGVTLGYVVTFVMTQRILIHQRETAAKFSSRVKTATPSPGQSRQPDLQNHPSVSRILQEIEDDFDYIKSSAIFGSGVHASALSRTDTSQRTPDGVAPTDARNMEDIEMNLNAHNIIEQIPAQEERRQSGHRAGKSGGRMSKKSPVPHASDGERPPPPQ